MVVHLLVGCHVCVVDPGVGTLRRGVVIQVGRGDYLIGPDNGTLMTAPRFLGGIQEVVVLENPRYKRQPVSAVFHGRDVFARAAAHLCNNVPLSQFGPLIETEELVEAPYEEACVKKDQIAAQVIHVNKFGSVHLNLRHHVFDQWQVKKGNRVFACFGRRKVALKVGETFGDVPKDEAVIFKDEFGRVELAINQGSFTQTYRVSLGEQVVLSKN